MKVVYYDSVNLCSFATKIEKIRTKNHARPRKIGVHRSHDPKLNLSVLGCHE